MSNKDLEQKLKQIAPDCKPKVVNKIVRLSGGLGNDEQMRQMDAAFELIEDWDVLDADTIGEVK